MDRQRMLTSAVAAVALQLVGCTTPTDAPYFDPRQFQSSERMLSPLDQSRALREMATEQEDPLGGPGDVEAGTTRPSDVTAGPAVGPTLGADGEPILRMTLQQCVQRTVLFNHDVKVAGYQPSIDASRVTEAEAAFDPIFFDNIQFQNKDDETAGEVFTNPINILNSTTGFYDRENTYTNAVGFKGNLVSGGQLQIEEDNSYNSLLPQRYIENPYYQNKMTLQLTQPLLRAFGADVNQAKIFISRNDARVSLLEFRKAIEENISKTEEAYWQLVEAQRNVDVEEYLLKENESSYQLQFGRLQQRLVSSLEVSQVQTSLEARRAALIRAKTDARDISDALKQLMNDPNLPVSSPVLITPADDPVLTPMRFDIDDQINSAMENRFELGEQLLKIDTADVTYNLAKNNTLPKLDFVGSVSPNVVDGDFGVAFNNQLKFGHYEYSLGLNLEMPVGNREGLAILRRTELQREQSVEQYASLVAEVSLEVRQAAREVATTYDLILTNRQSRLAAQRALADVVERQEKGTEPLTPEFVQLRLDLADRLGEQQEAENKAISDYNIALERLERVKGTLLRYNNVVMQEEPYKNQGLLH